MGNPCITICLCPFWFPVGILYSIIRIAFYILITPIPVIFGSLFYCFKIIYDNLGKTYYILIITSRFNICIKILLSCIIFIPIILIPILFFCFVLILVIIYPIIFGFYDGFMNMFGKQNLERPGILFAFMDLFDEVKKINYMGYHKWLNNMIFIGHEIPRNITERMEHAARMREILPTIRNNPLSIHNQQSVNTSVSPERRSERPINAVASNKIKPYEVWQYIALKCIEYGTFAKNNKFITKEALESVEPSVVLGIPSFALFEMVYNSLNINGIKLSADFEINKDNIPIEAYDTKDFLKFYNFLFEAKNEIKKINISRKINGSPSDEYLFLVKWLATWCNDELCKTNKIKNDRLVNLKQCVSKIQSAATFLTRISHFNALFANSLSAITQSQTNTTSIVNTGQYSANNENNV